MAVRTEPSERWVRAFVGDTAVVDSRGPVLFYEDVFPIPNYAFNRGDVRTDLLQESSDDPDREPFFFLPKGPVSQWYDLEVGGRTIRHAAWTRDTLSRSTESPWRTRISPYCCSRPDCRLATTCLAIR
ncbi:MAG: DUF427 domain-containing protein [Geodermatophilaceae bacterium]